MYYVCPLFLVSTTNLYSKYAKSIVYSIKKHLKFMLVYHTVIMCREYRTLGILFKNLYIILLVRKVLVNNFRRIFRSIPQLFHRFLEILVNIGSVVEDSQNGKKITVPIKQKFKT